MILHFTDPHFNRSAFAFIAKTAESLRADVCITGDFLDLRHSDAFSIEKQIAWVRAWIAEQPFKLFLCSGNHDPDNLEDPFTAAWLREVYNGKNLFSDGQRGKASSGEIIGCVPYGEVFYDSRQTYENVDIMLFHEPPSGTDAALMEGNDFGSMDVAGFLASSIRAPKLLLCGHVHRPRRQLCRFENTLIVNPGSCDQVGEYPFASITLVTRSGKPAISLHCGRD